MLGPLAPPKSTVNSELATRSVVEASLPELSKTEKENASGGAPAPASAALVVLNWKFRALPGEEPGVND